jgi:hypothetical protein
MWIKGPEEKGQFIYLFRMSGGFVSSRKVSDRYQLPSKSKRGLFSFWRRPEKREDGGLLFG